MAQEREFDRLEEFVKRLLTQFDNLREENRRIEGLLRQRDMELIDLKAELLSADSARGDITNRVRGLIEQIEEWESDLAETDPVPVETGSVLDAPVTEAKVEAMHSENAKEDAGDEEKEGGLQQNLFNVEPRTTNIGE